MKNGRVRGGRNAVCTPLTSAGPATVSLPTGADNLRLPLALTAGHAAPPAAAHVPHTNIHWSRAVAASGAVASGKGVCSKGIASRGAAAAASKGISPSGTGAGEWVRGGAWSCRAAGPKGVCGRGAAAGGAAAEGIARKGICLQQATTPKQISKLGQRVLQAANGKGKEAGSAESRR